MNIEQIGSVLVTIILFALVLFASYYCSKKVAKISMKDNHSKYMKLEDRLMVGQDKSLAVVTLGSKHFLISICANEISLLTELKEDDMTELQSPEYTFPAGIAFKDILKSLGRNKDRED